MEELDAAWMQYKSAISDAQILFKNAKAFEIDSVNNLLITIDANQRYMMACKRWLEVIFKVHGNAIVKFSNSNCIVNGITYN